MERLYVSSAIIYTEEKASEPLSICTLLFYDFWEPAKLSWKLF